MTSDVPLDYAVFQLSPKRSRCELFVSYDGTTEKLASGLIKPYVSHLKVAEEQVALAVKSIKLEVDRYKNAETWFTKGTLERFVKFVGTPEVLEMVNTYDAEMSQLEAARRIYSQGGGGDQSSALGGDGGASAAFDGTKKELLRAIDVRLAAVKEDLTTACNHASAAGFNPENISELQMFADRFGAHRLSEACSKFISLSQRRADLFYNIHPTSTWKSSFEHALRSSSSSDMSLDDYSDDQPKHLAFPNTTNKVTFPLRRFSREPSPSPIDDGEERENAKVKDKDIEKDKDRVPTTSACNSTTESDQSLSSTSAPTPQLTRRLSVQERISMFENKVQKESSPSTTAVASGGGKPELRRLSSDVTSSTDKAVLRRWSGASDMSIDVSGERKELDSNANTPTPTSNSHPIFPPKSKDQSDLKAEEGAKESKLPLRPRFGSHLTVSSGGGSSSEESTASEANFKVASFSGRSSENVELKDQPSGEAPFGKGGEFGLENQPTSIQTQFRPQPGKTEQFGSSDQIATEEKVKSSPRGGSKLLEEDIRKNSRVSSGYDGRSGGLQGEVQEERMKDQKIPKSAYRTSQKRTVEAASESASEAYPQFVVQNKGGESDFMPGQPRWRSAGEEVEKVGRKDSELLEKQADYSAAQMENSGSYRGKFQGYGSASAQMRKPGARSEESGTGKSAPENHEFYSSTSSVPVDQVQRVRQINVGMNDELKWKANELEKLFAEHQLRAPGDQSNSARRTRPADMPMEQQVGSVNRKPAMETSPAQLNTMKWEAELAVSWNNFTPLTKASDDQDYDATPKQNIYSLGFSDDSRGKLYQKYMKKRDAKLKEDWSSKRAEKDAKIKAMQVSLEKSRAEMKVRLAGSADKRSSANDARQRAEKLRSFSARSALNREQPLDLNMSDEDEDQAEFLGKKLSETYMGDTSSRSAQNKKGIPSKTTVSSTPRNSAAHIPRSSGKASNSAAGRRRLPYDNPLAQSVPNFSDLRKENTKPSSAGSRLVRPQGRNHARKKSVNEDSSFVSEEKPRRSHSLRKSTASPVDLNSSRNSDDIDDAVFTPTKHSKEGNESNHFQTKGNGVGHIAGKGRSKASMMVEALGNGHDVDDISFETEDMTDVAKEDDDDYFETTVGRESADIDNNKDRSSQESDKSANFGYGNRDALGSLSHEGLASATELPASMSSLFRSIGSIQDSPGASPGSWNSRVHNPFSFPHEISDIDASDSPVGSPASWNLHSLTQTDAEAARMRKKWGAAQKPVVGDSSHSSSRKDMTKGLKRFLKFGRKNRATESMADWISATTSEGDDDTEDGRDIANRSSEDLRKSRMGFSHSHHCDEGFTESDLFNDQAIH
ncbi:COP1-interacting protein 7 [Bienertia sinuspersici]